MLAIERTVNAVFSLRTAANRANFAANARTISPRALFFAKFAKNVHLRISLSYHREMRRTDLYIKVELVMDETEQPERLASEICRLIRKLYGVRSAEVSNMVEKE